MINAIEVRVAIASSDDSVKGRCIGGCWLISDEYECFASKNCA